MNSYKFIINEEPITQCRPRVYGRVAIDPRKQQKAWVKILIAKQMEKHGYKRLSCPISIDITFTYKIPKSWSKKRKKAVIEGLEKCTNNRDIDNTFKFFTDSMNELVYDDDKQIYHAEILKQYGEESSTEIEIFYEI